MRELSKKEIRAVSGGASYTQTYNPYNPFTNPNSYINTHPVTTGAVVGGVVGGFMGGPVGAVYGAYEGAAVGVIAKGSSGAIDAIGGY